MKIIYIIILINEKNFIANGAFGRRETPRAKH